MKKIHIGPTHRHKERRCPKCGLAVNAATPVNHDDAPSAERGDVTFCAYCDTLLVFDSGMTLRQPTAAELVELQSEKEFWETLQAARSAVRKIFKNARR